MNTQFKKFLQFPIALLMATSMVSLPAIASAKGNPWTGFTTPVFGLTQGPGNNLLIADAVSGIFMMN